MKEFLNNLFCCPKCKQDLQIFPMENKKIFKCDCGHEIFINNGIIDFNMEESNWFDDSISDGKLNAFLTKKDKKRINIAVNRDEVSSALKEGFKIIQDHIKDSSIKFNLDLCTGLGNLYRNEDFVKATTDKLFILTDILEISLKSIKEKLDSISATNYVYVVCDATNLPIKDNSIEGISTIAACQNGSKAKTIFKEAIRVLKPNHKMSDLAVFLEDGSRSVLLADHLNWGDMITEKRYTDYVRTFDNLNIETHIVKKVNGRFKTDFFPLKGDTMSPTIISLIKRNA